MARPQSPPVLSQLRGARSYPEQAAALRALKNEVVGHIQKKKLRVGMGALDSIVATLTSSKLPTKPNGKEGRPQLLSRALTDAESVKLQALQLIASFAIDIGGAAFLAPFHAARVVPAVLAHISPLVNPPKIVVAALKALTNIAEAAAVVPPSSPIDLRALSESVFTPSHLESLNLLLSISSPRHLLRLQLTLASGLICRLCRDERHQQSLTTAGVLDTLATQLARIAVSHGLVVPGAEELAYSDGLYEAFPEPACAGARIGPILAAIASILGDSRYRANRLVNSPALIAIFPPVPPEDAKDAQGRQRAPTAIECLLPSLPISFSRRSSSPNSLSERSAFRRATPSKVGPFAAPEPSRAAATQGSKDDGGSSDEFESPLLPWLIKLTRTLEEYDRLMAASVLAALFKAGLGRKGVRETSIGLLVIPILVGMIVRHNIDDCGNEGSDWKARTTQREALERAPAILAKLISDSEYLQKAAYDCNAVKVFTALLKRAYMTIPLLDRARYWLPHMVDDDRGEYEPEEPFKAHRIRVRESALKAIGALSAGKEDYRKALLAEDLVPYVAESLCEFPDVPRPAKDRPKDRASLEASARKSPCGGLGANPVPVLIAGCHVVRMLARSVSILRTALVDHGVALPILQFMKHDDMEVQVAATATMINLLVEVSPVRELLTENDVMGILCEHAHSANPTLRLNALWALKHFVDAVGPDLKKASLERLGPGWLVQLISGDDKADGLTARSSRTRMVDDEDFHLEEGAAREEGKELESDEEDSEMEVQALTEEPLRWVYGSNGTMRELDASRSSRLRQAEDRLATIREMELNPGRRARNDELAVQEQGLDFIRNLIGRPESAALSETPSETTEMIDHLFGELGQARFFEILASKLRAKVLDPFSRRRGPASGREGRMVHPQARIMVAVIYILVHLAASIPRHRQLVVSQTELLKLLVQQASSKERDVRVALCHLVINLTWQEDEAEAEECGRRAHELKRLGFLDKMELLKHQDLDLDVRERAKTAAWQIEQATF